MEDLVRIFKSPNGDVYHITLTAALRPHPSALKYLAHFLQVSNKLLTFATEIKPRVRFNNRPLHVENELL
jgi:tRNA(Glu) U13 pseudouridine synthase TruD